MTDRELIEAAAKAAGIELGPWQERQSSFYKIGAPFKPANWWNPLTDDGDALRLAVTLGLAVIPYPIYAKPKHSVIAKQYSHASYLRGESEDVRIEEIQVYGGDPAAATRRAIVRAAAALAGTAPAEGGSL